MARKILGLGLSMTENTRQVRSTRAEMWAYGPSTDSADPFAGEPVVEVVVEGKSFTVPLQNVEELIRTARVNVKLGS